MTQFLNNSLPNEVSRGERLKAATVNGIIRSIGFSKKINMPGMATEWNQQQDSLFDLIKIGTDTFSIKSNTGKEAGLYISGEAVTIEAGTGVTWDGTDSEWDAESVSTDGYVFILVNLTDSTAEIKFEATLPTPEDDEQVIPLWFIKWDSSLSEIQLSGIIDLRKCYTITESESSALRWTIKKDETDYLHIGAGNWSVRNLNMAWAEAKPTGIINSTTGIDEWIHNAGTYNVIVYMEKETISTTDPAEPCLSPYTIAVAVANASSIIGWAKADIGDRNWHLLGQVVVDEAGEISEIHQYRTSDIESDPTGVDDPDVNWIGSAYFTWTDIDESSIYTTQSITYSSAGKSTGGLQLFGFNTALRYAVARNEAETEDEDRPLSWAQILKMEGAITDDAITDVTRNLVYDSGTKTLSWNVAKYNYALGCLDIVRGTDPDTTAVIEPTTLDDLLPEGYADWGEWVCSWECGGGCDCDIADVTHTDYETWLDWAEANGFGSGASAHADLTDIVIDAAAVADHDGRHWTNSTAGAGDETTNFGSAIGNGSAIIINLTSAIVNDGDGDPIFDAGNGKFIDGTYSSAEVNVRSQTINDANGDLSIDWDSRSLSSNWSVDGDMDLTSGNVYKVNTVQVVGAQGATIADPAGGGTVDSEARSAINDIIDRLQAHGLIA